MSTDPNDSTPPKDQRQAQRRQAKQQGRARRAELLLEVEAKEKTRHEYLEARVEELEARVAQLEALMNQQPTIQSETV
ncbi:hypothetical protein G6O69_21035 [Pseudenhygromyxa sp. WMMC2535]|uniref:hypothetical protein n=1 Tax=Pseudenhygromyxa sp. WMMC2535 TaxID=2712867 RepID=UPI001595033E|nr:hypothetical protein [Pseudenhygromyxa sp. WMMC2535]NVB40338.1 hypothetical protein [Pseudenhygromyxa sp. WMMC2535]